MSAPISKNMSQIVTPEIQVILKKYSTFTVQESREKIRCELSGHEMPCRIDMLESYIKGKKFTKLLEKHRYQYEKQHLTPSNKRGRGHQLFCTLTLRHINNTPKHIQKHLDGRRFKKALARWEECQKTGETFKPNRPKQKRNLSDTEMTSEADESNQGDKEVEDDLQDLYPDEDFEGSDSEDLSDSDVDLHSDKDQRLKNPSTSQQDEEDSEYEFEDLENDNGEDRMERKSKKPGASQAKKGQEKRKLNVKNKDPKQKKSKT